MNLIDEIRTAKYEIREIKLGPFWVLAEAEDKKLVGVSFFHKKESSSVSEVNISGGNKKNSENWDFCHCERSEAISSPILERLQEDLINYWRGEKIDFSDYPLKLDNCPPFTKKVWTLTRKIPYGELRSYKWVAEKIHTKGYRAVGAALARNPFPIIIPCHRVIRENGSLGGYSPGLKIKRKLLEKEGIQLYVCRGTFSEGAL